MVSTAPTGNASGTTESMFDLITDRGRVDLDLGVYRESKGWTGQAGWKQSSVEPLRDITVDELAIDKVAMPVSLIFTLHKVLGTPRFLPPVKSTFNDQDCIKVNVIGIGFDIYVNEKTKLIEGMVVPDFLRITSTNYQEVNGVQVAHTSKVEILVTNSTFTAELKKVEFNVKLDAVKFLKPEN